MSQAQDPTQPATPQPAVVEPVSADQELAALESQMLQLQAQGRNGASWFYWVAGLSMVNSVISVAGGNRRFLFGMGITQLSDAMGLAIAQKNPEMATVVKGVAFGFALVAAAVMVLFGWLANKRSAPMFALGMVLYVLDGLLLLMFQDMISMAFHGFVLYQMWQGLNAYRQLSTILASAHAAS